MRQHPLESLRARHHDIRYEASPDFDTEHQYCQLNFNLLNLTKQTTMTTLGLSPTTSFAAPAAFLAWNWCFAYVALSSRPWKQACGIDHNGNPRQDVAKYADAAIREGKMTRAQLERIQRVEAAGANSTDGFAFFASSVLFALIADVPRPALMGACTTYTVARLLYGAVYVFIPHDSYSQLRGISWWVSNGACLYLLWKGGRG